VISNDGLHYREPVTDFRMVPCAEDQSTIAEIPWATRGLLAPTIVDHPANVQGNGMENVGDYTLFWYGKWPEVNADGVRVARWTRDRLGYFAMDPAIKGDTPTVISCPIDLGGGAKVKLSLNVDGVGEKATATVELLTEQFTPIPGLSGADGAAQVVEGGLRQAVLWPLAKHQQVIEPRSFGAASTGRVRVKVTFGGVRPEDIKLYAIYIDKGTVSEIPHLYLPPHQGCASESVAQDALVPLNLLSELSEMGFTDEDSNIRALTDANGDIKVAIKVILANERANAK